MEEIKSTESIHRSFVLFENTTERIVNVYWVNYHSKHILYTSLKPDAKSIVNTYKTHPWIFIDDYGERMHVDNKGVFWPKPWFLTNIDLNDMSIKRQKVKIHFPLRSLKENSLCKILNCIKQEESLNLLELPKSLEEDLKNYYKIKNSWMVK